MVDGYGEYDGDKNMVDGDGVGEFGLRGRGLMRRTTNSGGLLDRE